jgi:DNA-binding transcriptional ArsR family regulator
VLTLAEFFRTLADPTRLRLLEFVMTGEHTLDECVEFLAQPTFSVSGHLRRLSRTGYVVGEWREDATYYRVVDSRVPELVLLGREFSVDKMTRLCDCRRIEDEQRP